MKKAIYILTIVTSVLFGIDVALQLRLSPKNSEEKLTALKGDTDRHAEQKDTSAIVIPEHKALTLKTAETETSTNTSPKASKAKTTLGEVDLKRMASDNPFYREAAKVISGKLNEEDSRNRRMILNYCEHFRTAYTSKDIDFLKQVFSEQALIIIGNVVKTAPSEENSLLDGERVQLNIRTKNEYLDRLAKVFAANKTIDVKFSDFKILRHPTRQGIYGVSLRQKYRSDRYADDGYLFLLWDFTDHSMPKIHVRTWQPAASVGSAEEIIGITDFNLQ